jgi:hypothetical protein
MAHWLMYRHRRSLTGQRRPLAGCRRISIQRSFHLRWNDLQGKISSSSICRSNAPTKRACPVGHFEYSAAPGMAWTNASLVGSTKKALTPACNQSRLSGCARL